MSNQKPPEHRHVAFNAAGVMVQFPYEPYDIQREYVECVIKAAHHKQNALLESPTGTGKTLSLLCSSLAWQQSSVAKSVIYYTSRTHLQLSQAAKEMKRTAYSAVPAVVIASRSHMCLNDDVRQHQDHSINRACHNAIAKNGCQYYQNYEHKLESRLNSNQVHDIEDLYNFGRENQCCPYYTSKKFAENKASIVFMPYNYLLDLSVSKSTQLRLENSVIIFDEGHNLDSVLKESASAHFTQLYLKEIEDSCDKLPTKLNDVLNYERHGLSRRGYDPDKKRSGSGIVDEFAKPKSKSIKEMDKENKKNPIEELAEKLTNDKIRLVRRCASSLKSCIELMTTKQGQYQDTKCSMDSLFSKLDESGIEFFTSDTIITTLDSMASFWSMAGVMNPATVARYLTAITNLSHFISILYPQGCMSKTQKDNHIKRLKEYYAAHIGGTFEKQTVLLNSNKLINWQLDLWCLHPAVGFKRVFDNLCVVGPRSLVITSGTLAPMRPIEVELETKFDIVREFKHLITKNQLNVMLLAESPRKYSLMATYEEAKKPKYSEALGETLLTLFRALPFGTLVFFPSYSLMNRVLSYWENGKPILWKDMVKTTKIFTESKEQTQFNSDMTNFKRRIDSGGKAVFLGVCRGKLSEGTNLQSNHCRSVIIVGLPFPSLHDARVIETKDFHSRRGDPQGQNWYTQQMRRALSQAFGRVIRSKDDFGMLFLCDPRFTHYKFSLSEWIRPFYPTDPKENYKVVCQEIKDFFMSHNVDVSAITFNEASLTSSQSSIFEIDQSTTKSSISRSIQPTTSNKNPKDNSAISNLGSKSPRSVRAAMIEAYTVDRETYNRMRTSKPTPSVSNDDHTGPRGASASKKLRTTSDVFNSLFDSELDPSCPKQSAESQVDGSSRPDHIEIVIDDSENDNFESRRKIQANAYNYKCYICLNTAVKPHVINCVCARIGCLSCLKGLNNKNCGKCGTTLKLRNFKQKLFNVFQKREV